MESVGTKNSLTKILQNFHQSRPKWSFSKQKRFKDNKYVCQSYCYNLSSQLRRNNISIGKSQRSNLILNNSNNPAPGSYQCSSSFEKDKNKSLKKGFSFGINRTQIKFQNYYESIQKTPAPSDYEIQRKKVRSKAYSIRFRTNYPKNCFLPDQNIQYPGPGSYQTTNSMSSKYQFIKNKFEKIKNLRPLLLKENSINLRKQKSILQIKKQKETKSQRIPQNQQIENYILKSKQMNSLAYNVEKNNKNKIDRKIENKSTQKYRPGTAVP